MTTPSSGPPPGPPAGPPPGAAGGPVCSRGAAGGGPGPGPGGTARPGPRGAAQAAPGPASGRASGAGGHRPSPAVPPRAGASRTADGSGGSGPAAGGAGPVWIDAARIAALLSPAGAADAVERMLLDGLDPDDPVACPGRSAVAVPAGELLMMPAAFGRYAGVKVAGVAPANPGAGLPRITGGYLLMDGATLLPLALLDGAALTSLRTPAVSAVAVRKLAAPGASGLVLFGAGPQAYGHLHALRAEHDLTGVTVVARRPGPRDALVGHALALGLDARGADPSDGPAVGAALAGAGIVCCCTTARTPLFDGGLVPDHAVVVAVGSHEPDAREVDTALVRRSEVVVESRRAALAEAGDLLIPVAEGAVTPRHITGTLAELVVGRMEPRTDRPRLFKGVGMAWQDLAVAAEVHRRHLLTLSVQSV